jgi:nicotinate-nucleotide adenylyltransferase
MVRLALAEGADARCVASMVDGPRPDGLPNYTVDALEALQASEPEAALFAIAGADSFLTLGQWRSPERLLSLAQWIVVSRPEFPLTEAQLAPLGLTADQRERVHLLTTVHEEISATELRNRLRSGDPCAGLLPAEVAGYIQRRGLYR